MSLRAIQVTENSLDLIAPVNGGLRPEVEMPTTIFIHDDDPDGHNDIMSESAFFANYWFDMNVTDTDWTEVKEVRQVPMHAIAATKLKRDHVFEMFGNLYQVDDAYTIGDATQDPRQALQVHAHLIEQLDSPRLDHRDIVIFLSPQTRVFIEA